MWRSFNGITKSRHTHAGSCRSGARTTRWRKPRIAPRDAHLPRVFTVTHPFHPLQGQTFELLTYRFNCGEDRVVYVRADGRVRIPCGRSRYQLVAFGSRFGQGQAKRRTYSVERGRPPSGRPHRALARCRRDGLRWLFATREMPTRRLMCRVPSPLVARTAHRRLVAVNSTAARVRSGSWLTLVVYLRSLASPRSWSFELRRGSDGRCSRAGSAAGYLATSPPARMAATA